MPFSYGARMERAGTVCGEKVSDPKEGSFSHESHNLHFKRDNIRAEDGKGDQSLSLYLSDSIAVPLWRLRLRDSAKYFTSKI